MKSQPMKSRIFVALILIVFACSDDDKEPTIPYELEEYATRFFEEAAKRGISVPPQSSIPITMVDAIPENEGFVGIATFDPPTVRIKKNSWDEFTEMQREWIMFHELGHAALRRVHCEERLPDCKFKSIMYNLSSTYDQRGEERD